MAGGAALARWSHKEPVGVCTRVGTWRFVWSREQRKTRIENEEDLGGSRRPLPWSYDAASVAATIEFGNSKGHVLVAFLSSSLDASLLTTSFCVPWQHRCDFRGGS